MDARTKAGRLTIQLAAGDSIPASVSEVVAERFASGTADASVIDGKLCEHGQPGYLEAVFQSLVILNRHQEFMAWANEMASTYGISYLDNVTLVRRKFDKLAKAAEQTETQKPGHALRGKPGHGKGGARRKTERDLKWLAEVESGASIKEIATREQVSTGVVTQAVRKAKKTRELS
jgi:hypothetical protein